MKQLSNFLKESFSNSSLLQSAVEKLCMFLDDENTRGYEVHPDTLLESLSITCGLAKVTTNNDYVWTAKRYYPHYDDVMKTILRNVKCASIEFTNDYNEVSMRVIEWLQDTLSMFKAKYPEQCQVIKGQFD